MANEFKIKNGLVLNGNISTDLGENELYTKNFVFSFGFNNPLISEYVINPLLKDVNYDLKLQAYVGGSSGPRNLSAFADDVFLFEDTLPNYISNPLSINFTPNKTISKLILKIDEGSIGNHSFTFYSSAYNLKELLIDVDRVKSDLISVDGIISSNDNLKVFTPVNFLYPVSSESIVTNSINTNLIDTNSISAEIIYLSGGSLYYDKGIEILSGSFNWSTGTVGVYSETITLQEKINNGFYYFDIMSIGGGGSQPNIISAYIGSDINSTITFIGTASLVPEDQFNTTILFYSDQYFNKLIVAGDSAGSGFGQTLNYRFLLSGSSIITDSDYLYNNMFFGNFMGDNAYFNELKVNESITLNENLIFNSSSTTQTSTQLSALSGDYVEGIYFGANKISQNNTRLINIGETWTAKESSRNWKSVSISSDGKYQTAVVNNGLIYISSDYGNTWTPKESSRYWFSVSISSDGKYQTAVNGGATDRLIYISNDYGNNWTPKESDRFWKSVSISSDGKYQTAVASGYQIYISKDYGNTWTPKESNRVWESVSISSDGKYQTAVVNGDQIYISNDYGNTWTAKDSYRTWKSVSISSDGKYQTAVNGGGFNRQIYISNDYGNTWTPKESDRFWNSVSISSDGKYQTAVVGGGQIYVSKADELIDANLLVNGGISANEIHVTSGITFDTSFDSLPDLGQLAWHNSDATLDLGLGVDFGSLSIGEETLYRVKNNTSSDIIKGTVVQSYGVSPGGSGRLQVAPATATGIFPSKYIMGLAKETILANGEGYVTHFGKIKDINTEQWGQDGVILYADPYTFGGLTSSTPLPPNNKVTVAVIVKSNNPNGTLFVRPSFEGKLDDNESVIIDNLQNNETLVYNSSLSAFENTDTIPGYVKTVLTDTPSSSAINFMVAVTALPVSPDPKTLYVIV